MFKRKPEPLDATWEPVFMWWDIARSLPLGLQLAKMLDKAKGLFENLAKVAADQGKKIDDHAARLHALTLEQQIANRRTDELALAVDGPEDKPGLIARLDALEERLDRLQATMEKWPSAHAALDRRLELLEKSDDTRTERLDFAAKMWEQQSLDVAACDTRQLQLEARLGQLEERHQTLWQDVGHLECPENADYRLTRLERMETEQNGRLSALEGRGAKPNGNGHVAVREELQASLSNEALILAAIERVEKKLINLGKRGRS